MDEYGYLEIYSYVLTPNGKMKRVVYFRKYSVTQTDARVLTQKFRNENPWITNSEIMGKWTPDSVIC
jgi:hypothetical protein